MRRTAAGTAVAAAAMAALSASQAPGFLIPVAHAAAAGPVPQATTAPSGEPIDGGSPYITDLPPLNTPPGPFAPVIHPTGGPTITVPSGVNLPTTVLAAYRRAEAAVAQSDPGCHLPWELLAAIGQVESGQARGGAVDADGTTLSPILGPVLNGNGFADITDTDGGAYDGDAVHDRAVGPMQFIPSTWRTWGADGNGDGTANPNNVYDAALAAAHYLCADGRDLAVPEQMDRAILGYNHSQAYLNLVRSWYEHFRQGGAVGVPDDSDAHGPAVHPLPADPPPPPAGGHATPTTTPTQGGSVSPPPTTPSGTPSPSTSPTGVPSTSPTGGGDGTTGPTTNPPTTPPTTDPTTPPTDTPTTPGCTDSPTPTPTDSGTASPSPTDTPTTDPTGDPTTDPCAPTTSPTPSDTAGETPDATLTPAG